MSTPRRPRLPEHVYVRRRVAALLVICLVVVLFIVLVVKLAGRGGQDGDPSARDVAETTTTAPAGEDPDAPAPATSPTTTEPPESSPSPEPPPEPSPEPGPPAEPVIGEITRPEVTECAPADLVVSAWPAIPDVGPGEQPRFYMTVQNPTNGDCLIDLDREPLRFEVLTMADQRRVWGDIDCNPSEGRGELSLVPGQQRTYEAVWSRTTSAPDSCADRRPVEPGAYLLVGSVGANASAPQPFTLR